MVSTIVYGTPSRSEIIRASRMTASMASTNAIWPAIPFIVQEVLVVAGSGKRARPIHLVRARPVSLSFPATSSARRSWGLVMISTFVQTDFHADSSQCSGPHGGLHRTRPDWHRVPRADGG